MLLIILGRWQHASSSSLSRRVSMCSLPLHSTVGNRQRGRRRYPNGCQTFCHFLNNSVTVLCCSPPFRFFLSFHSSLCFSLSPPSLLPSPPPSSLLSSLSSLFFSTGVSPAGCRDTLRSPHLCLPHRPHHSLLWLCLFSPCSPPLRRTTALRWWGAYPPALVLSLRAPPGFEWGHWVLCVCNHESGASGQV